MTQIQNSLASIRPGSALLLYISRLLHEVYANCRPLLSSTAAQGWHTSALQLSTLTFSPTTCCSCFSCSALRWVRRLFVLMIKNHLKPHEHPENQLKTCYFSRRTSVCLWARNLRCLLTCISGTRSSCHFVHAQAIMDFIAEHAPAQPAGSSNGVKIC